MSYTSKLKKSLNKCLDNITSCRDEFCQNPNSDFTRNRKSDFTSIMKAVLCFGGKSLNKELSKYLDLTQILCLLQHLYNNVLRLNLKLFINCSSILSTQIKRLNCFTVIVCSLLMAQTFTHPRTKMILIH